MNKQDSIPSTTPSARPPLLLLIGLAAFGPLSIDLYLPSMPDLMRLFQTDVSSVQLTLSVFVAGFALAQLVYGPLSDRFGRRPVLMGGLALYAVASLLCLTAHSIGMLIMARLLQSLGACSGPVLGRAILRDSFPRDQVAKVMASMAIAMALAPALAPVIGGNLHAHFGWRANFILLSVFGVAILALSWFFLPETNRHLNPRALQPLSLLENYMTLLRDRIFLGHSLTISLCFGAMFGFISGSSFVLIDMLGVSPDHFGFCFAVTIVGLMSGSFLSSKLNSRLGLPRLAAIGSIGLGVCGLIVLGVCLSGYVSVPLVIGPIAVMYVFAGLLLPNSTALAIAPHARIAGSASALMGFLQMGAASLAGSAVGWLHNGTSLSMAAVMAFCTVAATIARWRIVGART